jgi:hypothetical protein
VVALDHCSNLALVQLLGLDEVAGLPAGSNQLVVCAFVWVWVCGGGGEAGAQRTSYWWWCRWKKCHTMHKQLRCIHIASEGLMEATAAVVVLLVVRRVQPCLLQNAAL